MEVLICDVCKKNPAKRFRYEVGTTFVSGASTDTVVETFDLCPECQLKVAETIIKTQLPKPLERGKAYYRAIACLINDRALIIDGVVEEN